LKLSAAQRARAQAFEPFDLGVAAAVREMQAPTSQAVAARLGASVDDVNIALHRMLRLGTLRMDGALWRET
jgi:hypothetical protein